MRKTFNTLLVLLAVFGFTSIGEAAQKHSVRHRPRHSTHLTTRSTVKKKVTKTKRHPQRTIASSKRKTATKPK